MKIEYAEISDIGNRASNQDYCLVEKTQLGMLFIVTDGLGAHHGSQYAAEYLCKSLKKLLPKFEAKFESVNPTDAYSQFVISAADEMRDKLLEINSLDAKTTCAVAYLNSRHCLFAHLGDSRIYRFKPDGTTWHTTDHSVAQELFEAGIITAEQINHHKMRHMLSKCYGVNENEPPSISIQTPLQPSDCLLLCTDGFWENMKTNDIANFRNTQNLKQELNNYIEHAKNTVPKLDNITAILIRAL